MNKPRAALSGNHFQLFSRRADDVWHADATPGGYEWWYFDALSDDGRDLLVVIFLYGFIFSPSYNHAVDAFRRGRTAQAPRPLDFPALAVTLYRDARPLARAINEFSAAEFSASRTHPECRIANNHFILDADNDNYIMRLDANLRGGRRWRGEFIWHLPATKTTSATSHTNAAHNSHAWNLVAPRGRVAGHWEVIAPRGQTLTAQEFSGNAYHDHNQDSRWLPATLAAWDWGRAHFPDGSTAVYYNYREHGATQSNCYLLRATPDGFLTAQPAQMVAQGAHQHHFGLRYARALNVTAQDGARLDITRRRVVDGSFFYLRCLDLATLTPAHGAPQTAPIVTEYLAPRALRWRWLDWLINMRIGRNGRGAFLP